AIKRGPGLVTLGEYLVRIAACETCHTPAVNGRFIRTLSFGGGSVISHGRQHAAASNITPDPSGIGYYSVEIFSSAMTSGRIGARRLSPIMTWYFYRNMTNSDRAAVWSYLRALPPVKHNVSNTDQPSECKICKNWHGLGKLN